MRSILSIIAGVLVGVFGVFLVKMINLSLYPNHADLNVSDPDLAAFVLIIIAHILGAFTAAFIASMVARTKRLNVGLLAGAILLSFTIWNSFSIGPPNVVSILDIVGTSLAVFLGARMGASRIVG